MPRKAAAKKPAVEAEIGDPAAETVVETSTPEAEPAPPEVTDKITVDEPEVGPSSVEEIVNSIILSVRGVGSKVDRSRGLAVVDLASRYVAAGQEFRQLYIQATDMAITISIVESMKSNYGGGTQTKTLASFQVPSTETQCFARIHQRFFGYKPDENLKSGEYLLNVLKSTNSTV